MFLLLSTLAAAGLGGPREITITVELPGDAPAENATYKSSTEVWRMRNGRVLGQLESNDPHLNCDMDGRWIRAEVAFGGSEFPVHDPEVLTCENEDVRVFVHVVRGEESWTGPAVADNRVALSRQRMRVQRASVTLPGANLVDDSRVVADVRGVQCVVEDDSTVSVRVGPSVFREQATCELPTTEGGTYALTIDLES
jgi:hypothetical protein